jgi:hypothetical protein
MTVSVKMPATSTKLTLCRNAGMGTMMSLFCMRSRGTKMSDAHSRGVTKKRLAFENSLDKGYWADLAGRKLSI